MEPFSLSLALLFYFLPTICALMRGHMSTGAIFVLNLLLGWTLLGWIIALVWSLTGNTKANFRYVATGNRPDGIGRWVDPMGDGHPLGPRRSDLRVQVVEVTPEPPPAPQRPYRPEPDEPLSSLPSKPIFRDPGR